MDRWGRDDERTRTFDLNRLRIGTSAAEPSTPSVPRPQRIVEIGPPPSTRDPRRE